MLSPSSCLTGFAENGSNSQSNRRAVVACLREARPHDRAFVLTGSHIAPGEYLPRSQKHLSILAPAVAAACASSRPSCGGNSQSTARHRFRRRSGSTPRDNLAATTPKSRSPARSIRRRPRLSSLQHLRSPRNSHTDLPPHTGPEVRKTRRTRTATPSLPLTSPRCRP
jgi:hypothetical protein